MSLRLAAFLALILPRILGYRRRRRHPVLQLATARRQTNWDSIDLTLEDLRRAA